jgi:pimeloyl-ACP methyl ester carboxylesterase
LKFFKSGQAQIAYQTTGPDTGPVILWAHGWGQSHAAFLALAESLAPLGQHILVDFPGFGNSPPPPGNWGTAEYADLMAAFIKDKTPVVWIGHSFGCRVGLQVAAKYPDLIAGLFLIAAAGLRRKRPLHKKLYMKGRIALFKILKKFIPAEKLYKMFGSADYKTAGSLRQTLVKVINEDLSNVAQKVNCPVILAYGTNDTETPLEMGERFNKLIRNSELLSFDGLDHYSILAEGRHPVAPHVKKFIEKHGRTHA